MRKKSRRFFGALFRFFSTLEPRACCCRLHILSLALRLRSEREERERKKTEKKDFASRPFALLERPRARLFFSRSPSFRAVQTLILSKDPFFVLRAGKKEGYFQKHATPPTAFLDAVVHAGEFETASVLERRRRCHHDHHHHHRDRFKASGLVFSDD